MALATCAAGVATALDRRRGVIEALDLAAAVAVGLLGMSLVERVAQGMNLNKLIAPWRSWCGLVAVLVVALDLLGHGILLSRGYFGQDDFLVLTDTARAGLGGLLEADHTDGLAPGASAPRLGASGRGAPVLGSGGRPGPGPEDGVRGRAVAVAADPIVGDRWLRLPLLVLFCVTPLTLWATQWWWMGIRFWPATFALLLACWALVARVQGGPAARGHLAVVVGVLVGLCFSPLAVLDPVVLLGLAPWWCCPGRHHRFAARGWRTCAGSGRAGDRARGDVRRRAGVRRTADDRPGSETGQS